LCDIKLVEWGQPEAPIAPLAHVALREDAGFHA
jgi:hypothetical protein